MDKIQSMAETVKQQLFASVPEQYRQQSQKQIFTTNYSRFTIQSVILVFVDVSYLLLYCFTIHDPAHFVFYTKVQLIKIMYDTVSALVFINLGPYNAANLLKRYIHVCYPALHAVIELLYFITGPQEFSSQMRLMAVPFIIGGIPIIRQEISFVLLFLFYSFSMICLNTTAYKPVAPYLLSYHGILVVYACACFISFTVYSWFVNNFISSMQNREIEKELVHSNKQLAYLSNHDALTGLHNRRYFNQHINETWAGGRQSGEEMAIIMIDIDYFKQYNDHFGHLAGDKCLCLVSEAIAHSLTDSRYTLARYGGEEFIIAAYIKKHAEILELVAAIGKNIENLKLPHPGSDASSFVTVSIGLAARRTAGLLNWETLMDLADKCLYLAKKNGRNQMIHSFDEANEFSG